VVLEAMSHGLPVVVSGPVHCGISRELHDGQEALLLHDPRNSADIARLARAVLDDADRADRLRGQGLVFAQAHTWERATLEYEALYQQVLSIRSL
jgi:glycosyltransferase involved in cell wall biosynthesis